jgi:aldehyde dehydrogenase (NAD+)
MTGHSFDSRAELRSIFDRLGLDDEFRAGDLAARSPVDGQVLGHVRSATAEDVASAVGRAHSAYLAWRGVPPPRRGELVRLLGEVLREEKETLGRLVSLEAGKILQELPSRNRSALASFNVHEPYRPPW